MSPPECRISYRQYLHPFLLYFKMLGSKGILTPLIPDCSALRAPAILKNIHNPLIFLRKMAAYSCFWRVPSSKILLQASLHRIFDLLTLVSYYIFRRRLRNYCSARKSITDCFHLLHSRYLQISESFVRTAAVSGPVFCKYHTMREKHFRHLSTENSKLGWRKPLHPNDMITF